MHSKEPETPEKNIVTNKPMVESVETIEKDEPKK